MSSPSHGPPEPLHRDGRDARDEQDGSGTWQVKARLLGVARNLTAATRLHDVLSLLRDVRGVEIWYTVNPGSDFSAGLEDYLLSVSGERHVLSWAEAQHAHFDLAVACAVHSSMHVLEAPLVVLPHGAGYNRLVARSTGDTTSPAGLSRAELTHDGVVVPDVICLSHEGQRPRLAVSCPEALPYTEVVGDPAHQRTRQSLPLRDRYRRSLGAVDGRKLVVVNSTWREHSLLGRWPDLLLRLVAELPADEFRVVLVSHPNVWAWHDPHSVRHLLGQALDAGLAVLPPQEGWRAALIAADWIVGDHGSTTFYGAALGLPTLLAADGLDELDPASPTAAFTRDAPRLDPRRDLYEQLLSIAATYDPAVSQAAFDDQVQPLGDSGRIVRDLLCGRLAHRGIQVPSEPPPPRPVPEPEPHTERGPQTFDVVGTVTGDGTVEIRRFPHVPHLGRDRAREARGFLAVTDEETRTELRQSAEVVVRTVAESEIPARTWAGQRARELPGLSVVVAALDAHRHLVLLREDGRLPGGRWLEAYAHREFGMPTPRLDPVLLGSALCQWLMTPHVGRLGGELTIRTGNHEVRVRFTGEE